MNVFFLIKCLDNILENVNFIHFCSSFFISVSFRQILENCRKLVLYMFVCYMIIFLYDHITSCKLLIYFLAAKFITESHVRRAGKLVQAVMKC